MVSGGKTPDTSVNVSWLKATLDSVDSTSTAKKIKYDADPNNATTERTGRIYLKYNGNSTSDYIEVKLSGKAEDVYKLVFMKTNSATAAQITEIEIQQQQLLLSPNVYVYYTVNGGTPLKVPNVSAALSLYVSIETQAPNGLLITSSKTLQTGQTSVKISSTIDGKTVSESLNITVKEFGIITPPDPTESYNFNWEFAWPTGLNIPSSVNNNYVTIKKNLSTQVDRQVIYNDVSKNTGSFSVEYNDTIEISVRLQYFGHQNPTTFSGKSLTVGFSSPVISSIDGYNITGTTSAEAFPVSSSLLYAQLFDPYIDCTATFKIPEITADVNLTIRFSAL